MKYLIIAVLLLAGCTATVDTGDPCRRLTNDPIALTACRGSR